MDLYIETLEESRRRENETKMYQTLNEKLENELKNCRNQMLIGQQGNNILGESTQQQILNVPGTVLSAIARKMTNLASSTESDDCRKVYILLALYNFFFLVFYKPFRLLVAQTTSFHHSLSCACFQSTLIFSNSSFMRPFIFFAVSQSFGLFPLVIFVDASFNILPLAHHT